MHSTKFHIKQLPSIDSKPALSLQQLLLRRFMFAYIAFALAIAGIQIFIEYHATKQEITDELHSLARTFSPGAESALWEMQGSLLQSMVNGLGANTAVVSVDVIDMDGNISASWRIPSGLEASPDLSVQRTLYHNDSSLEELGSLRIASSNVVLWARLHDTLWSVGITAIAIFAFLGLMLWLLARSLLVKPLVNFSNLVSAQSASGQVKPIDLGRLEVSEIETLKQCFNQLMQQLAESHARITEQNVLLEHEKIALQSESEKNLALLHNASDGIHIIDTEGNIIEASNSFCDMLGYTREEVIGMNVSQWDARFSRGEFIQIIRQKLSQPERTQSERTHRRKDGSVFDVELSSFPLELQGKPVLFYSARDITERKLAELKNEVLVKRQQALMQSALEGIHIMDALGNVVEVNDTFCQMLGYTQAEMQKMNVADWDAQWSRAELVERFNELILIQSARFETLHRRKDGTILNVEVNTTGIEIEGVRYLFASSRDITARKQAEEKLRIAAVTFETQEAILITDADSRILSVNQAFQRISGYSLEEVLGENPRMFQSGQYDEAFYQTMWASLLETGNWSGDILDKRKNGETYNKSINITAVYDDQHRVVNYVAVFRDATERLQTLEQLRTTATELAQANAQIEEERARLAERVMERTAQLLYANHAKDSFLATMSHEIRTPLGGLLGMMELLSLSQLDAQQNEMLQAARSSGKGLLRIVNGILDWSKIEAGKLELAPRLTSIPEMLEGVINTYSQIASEKNIQLKLLIDPLLSSAHIFDPLRMSQILNNFTSNSLKFTETGSIEVRAELLVHHQEYETVRFSVKDSGVGINQEQQAHLFQQYHQASAETARMYGGTGLGLSICRSLADLLGGEIGVQSTLGAGSTFSLTVNLPVGNVSTKDRRQLEEDTSRDFEPAIGPLATMAQHITVLMVDDHPLNRMLLKQQLSLLGLRADDAENGTEALSLWQTNHYDLIITDCHMPEMDGYELTYRIRELEQRAETKPVPIIAWTANVLAEEEQRCHEAGMDDILTKPTELAELKTKLLKWLVKSGVLT